MHNDCSGWSGICTHIFYTKCTRATFQMFMRIIMFWDCQRVMIILLAIKPSNIQVQQICQLHEPITQLWVPVCVHMTSNVISFSTYKKLIINVAQSPCPSCILHLHLCFWLKSLCPLLLPVWIPLLPALPAHQRVIFHTDGPGGLLLGERSLCYGQGQVGGGRRGPSGAGLPESLLSSEKKILGPGQSLNWK